MVKILNEKGEEKGEINLPEQFSEEIRSDLINRAVQSLQANKRKPYGASPDAGKRHSAELSRRRRKYRGSYGFGISRVTRKIHTRRGTRMYWVAALSPGTRGGRRAHPPKADKNWHKKINTNERRKAIRSALACVMNKSIVAERGHKVPDNYPFILDDSFQNLSKTKDIKTALTLLKLGEELNRADNKIIRPTRGKVRGRKYKKKVGPLLVTGEECALKIAGKNLPGVQIVTVNKINVELLAPGCHIGRLTLFTRSAIEKMEKEKLFN